MFLELFFKISNKMFSENYLKFSDVFYSLNVSYEVTYLTFEVGGKRISETSTDFADI